MNFIGRRALRDWASRCREEEKEDTLLRWTRAIVVDQHLMYSYSRAVVLETGFRLYPARLNDWFSMPLYLHVAYQM